MDTNQLAVTTPAPAASVSMMIMDPGAMGNIMRFAEMMAQSVITVPKHLQGHPADCMAITMQAMRWGMDPFVVAQKTHVVNGALGYEAQLINAVLQSSGAIKGRFTYEYKGSGASLECRVAAVPAGESEAVYGQWLKSSDVTTKNSPLWKTNPQQQMGYLQVKNWGRAYAPGAILGVYSTDELQDMPPPAEKKMGPAVEVEPEGLPAYPQERFDANLPKWLAMIAEGKRTADEIVAMVQSKATLTPEQIDAILVVDVEFTKSAEDLERDEFLAGMEAGQ